MYVGLLRLVLLLKHGLFALLLFVVAVLAAAAAAVA